MEQMICEATYQTLIDQLIEIYKKLQHILLISLNDLFLADHLLGLINDQLVQDSIEILNDFSFNFKTVLEMQFNTVVHSQYKNNLFALLSQEMDTILSNPLIEAYTPNGDNNMMMDINNSKIGYKAKKNHEVDMLSEFIKQITEKEVIETVIEIGCGKSYLTENILTNNSKILYIGIDMKDELIHKSSKKNTKTNAVFINSPVNTENFEDLYTNQISDIINSKCKCESSQERIMLFGLHSCGNLTSDTLKLYVKYPNFTHLAIVGCCLGLLKEYISSEARETSLFQKYIAHLGYDSSGHCLDQTLVYDYNPDIIGYPLSKHLLHSHSSLFFSRNARHIAMQNFSRDEEDNPMGSISYKKRFYRTLLQVFLENYLPELKKYYGYKQVEVHENMKFKEYLCNVFSYLEEKKKITDIAVLEKMHLLVSDTNEEMIKIFLEKYEKYNQIKWGVGLIRLKFAKVVEYLIALDRVIYLQEHGIEHVRLIKIFNSNISMRNILIYSSKILKD